MHFRPKSSFVKKLRSSPLSLRDIPPLSRVDFPFRRIFLFGHLMKAQGGELLCTKKPPTEWAAFRQQNTPGARNCSFSGVSFLPVNPAAVIPALGYASRGWVRSEVAVTESFRIREFILLFYNNFGNSESSRMESNRNTWVLLRVRFKFLGAWRIGWSLARGLVRFAFYTYSRKNFILYH